MQLDKKCLLVMMMYMSETKVKIVEAALAAFSRYGIRRVSMNEVAETAGVSRQTLYSHYRNKDELFAAAMTETVHRTMQTLEKAWLDCDGLSEQLDAYFEHAVFFPYRILQQHPDLKDLLNGVGPTTSEVAKEVEADKANLVATLFSPFQAKLAKAESAPIEVGKFIVRASTDFKYFAKDEAELKQYLHTLKAAVLAMT